MTLRNRGFLESSRVSSSRSPLALFGDYLVSVMPFRTWFHSSNLKPTRISVLLISNWNRRIIWHWSGVSVSTQQNQRWFCLKHKSPISSGETIDKKSPNCTPLPLSPSSGLPSGCLFLPVSLRSVLDLWNENLKGFWKFDEETDLQFPTLERTVRKSLCCEVEEATWQILLWSRCWVGLCLTCFLLRNLRNDCGSVAQVNLNFKLARWACWKCLKRRCVIFSSRATLDESFAFVNSFQQIILWDTFRIRNVTRIYQLFHPLNTIELAGRWSSHTKMSNSSIAPGNRLLLGNVCNFFITPLFSWCF